MENLLWGSSLLLVLPHRDTFGETGGIRHAEPSFTRSGHCVPSRRRPLGKFYLEQGWQAAATGQGGPWKAESGNVSWCF